MYYRPIHILAVFLACAAFNPLTAGQRLLESTRERCAILVHVEEPVRLADSLGTLRAWFADAEWKNCEGVLAPFQLIRVVCPPLTSPRLTIGSVTTSPLKATLLPSRADVADARQFPGWVTLNGIEDWRGFRIAEFEVRLVRQEDTGPVRLVNLDLNVDFEGHAEPMQALPREEILLPSVAVNGLDATHWWSEQSGRDRSTEYALDSWPEFDLYRLGVSETGLYQVRVETLQAQGVPILGAPSAQVKVFGNGGRLLPAGLLSATDSVLKEDAIFVLDGGDGTLDGQDRILFWGEGLKGFDYCDGSLLNGQGHASPYATQNVYWIGVDPSGDSGLRMETIPPYSTESTPVAITAGRAYLDQEQYIYAFNTGQTNSGVVWYMATIDAGSTRNFSLALDNSTSAAGTLKLRFATIGGSLSVSVNGISVHQGSFANPLEINVPEGVFIPGNNSIQLTNASSSQFHLNYIEATFQRNLQISSSGTLEFFAPAPTGYYGYLPVGLTSGGFIVDVSNPLRPRIAQGASCSDSSYAATPRKYWAVNGDRLRSPAFRGAKRFDASDYEQLRDPSNDAGLIIVTYDDWYDELEPLVEMHAQYQEEPLHAVRVKLTDIYDEFSWGVTDPVAIRNFLRYAYTNWRGESGSAAAPRYVLFVGDGDYDYRNLTSGDDDNWMPPWESGGDCTDDFYVEFDDAASLLNLMSGRWPVQSAQEVASVVEKTVSYAMSPLYGPWKNTATFVADDEWKSGHCSEQFHTRDSEDLINEVLPDYFTFKKLYQMLYPFRQSSSTSQKPDGTRDLIETLNGGTLLVNFMGHGNERVWTDEQLFVMERDFPLLDNGRMWPVVVAATCTWGGYDRPTERCFPELLIPSSNGGAIACIAATRFTYVGPNQRLAEVYYTEIFRQGIAVRRSLGEAMTIVKSIASGNKLYHTLGNPVLRLATPEYYAHVDSRDDSLQAGALFHLSGFISRTNSESDTVATKARGWKSAIDDEVWSDFQGMVEARVFDSEDSAAHYFPLATDCSTPSTTPYYYKLPGNAVFRGRSTIENGRFDVTFRVPRDIQYGGENAKVSLYFFGKADSEADSSDGIGIERPLRIASGAASVLDSIPPTIDVWLENSSFTSGDQVSTTPLLLIRLTDDSGINLSGEVGHRISARIDDSQPEDVTQFFNYDVDSYVTGQLSKTIGPLSLGSHRLSVEAWDSFNNLNVQTLDFVVAQGGEDGYKVSDVLNWPNPMSDVTYFTYALSQEGTRDVRIKIFTLSGKLIDEMSGLGTRQLYNSNSNLPWRGRDREGHELANGVYLYKVIAEHSAGYATEATGKLIILR